MRIVADYHAFEFDLGIWDGIILTHNNVLLGPCEILGLSNTIVPHGWDIPL